MLNDYKPTHDPNIDTFKVQYLLGFSALLAILFPYEYSISEVGLSSTPTGIAEESRTEFESSDTVDVLNLARVCCHFAPTLYAATHR